MKFDLKFLLLLFTISCNFPENGKLDLNKRIGLLEENFGIAQGDSYMFVDLDNCLNCSTLLKNQISCFYESHKGSVIALSRSKKKAKLILGDSLFKKVYLDTGGISKNLNLINDAPIIYRIREGECDSLEINFFK